MKDESADLTYRGIKYPLVFNINVMTVIQKKYGSFQQWAELILKDNGETDLESLVFGTWAMLTEGIDIHNETAEDADKLKPMTEKQVGRMLTEVGIEAATENVLNLVADSTKPAGDQPKNE